MKIADKNTISVVIPVYNRSHTITRALDSVLTQTIPPNEIIVVDDGSIDNLRDLLIHAYPNITYMSQAHSGVSRARNRGILAANSEWIAFLDSDDVWLPKKLECQLDAIKNSQNCHICHTDEIWIRQGKRVNPMKKHKKYGGFIFRQCLSRCLISPSSVMIRESVFKTVGMFDESLPACEDYELWLRITLYYQVLYLDTPLILKYGGHSDQLSQKHWGMDRFRVQALNNLLMQKTLSPSDHEAVLAMLLKKIKILLNGARKREKWNDCQYYEKLQRQLQ